MRPLRAFSALRLLALLTVYCFFAGLGAGYYIYSEYARDLPEDLTAMQAAPSRATQVFSADGVRIGEFFLQKRMEVPLERIPDVVQQAFISAEDRRFWEHPGFDLIGIARAAYSNFRDTGIRQGASTITQQVTRMLMLSNERTYDRKIRELILSLRVERDLDKRDILELYLNRIYLGHGAYGVQAAAEIYYGKDVTQLTPAEAALLGGLPQAPSRYSPHRNLPDARVRQHYVLRRMHEDGYITTNQLDVALAEPIGLVDADRPLNHVAAPYFVEHVRRWATETYGHQSVFYGGLRIFTSLDMRAQRSAEAAVRQGLEELDRQIGFRGPLDHLEDDAALAFASGPPRPYVPGLDEAALAKGSALLEDLSYVAVVSELPGRSGVVLDAGPLSLPMATEDARMMRKWRSESRTGLSVGDLVPVRISKNDRDEPEFTLAQNPDVQGALVAIDPLNGRIKAMVGGYSFQQSQFNRVTQAQRQIGSAMKPFIYLTALRKGMTQVDVLVDSPVAVRTVSGVWTPGNYDGEYKGAMTIRTALAKSINTISVRLVLKVGVDAVIETMQLLGIRSKVPRHVSIALGTPDLNLLEVVASYCAFANGGLKAPPQFVELVTAGDGTVMADFRKSMPSERAIPADLAYVIADLMTAVVARGTGRRAQELGRPAAGKTGTSTGHRDAWFLGYTADLVAGVWVGRDDFTPIGAKATGGSAALPIWLHFMKASHPDTQVRDFEPPPDVTFVRANELTGEAAGPGSPSARWIPFARGTIPPKFADLARTTRFERAPSLLEPAPRP